MTDPFLLPDLLFIVSVFRVGGVHPAFGLGDAHRLLPLSDQEKFYASWTIMAPGDKGGRKTILFGLVYSHDHRAVGWLIDKIEKVRTELMRFIRLPRIAIFASAQRCAHWYGSELMGKRLMRMLCVDFSSARTTNAHDVLYLIIRIKVWFPRKRTLVVAIQNGGLFGGAIVDPLLRALEDASNIPHRWRNMLLSLHHRAALSW